MMILPITSFWIFLVIGGFFDYLRIISSFMYLSINFIPKASCVINLYCVMFPSVNTMEFIGSTFVINILPNCNKNLHLFETLLNSFILHVSF